MLSKRTMNKPNAFHFLINKFYKKKVKHNILKYNQTISFLFYCSLKALQMPYQKSTQQYRRDIFALKTKLKQEQKYLQEIKQQYSDIDIFGQEKSYSFGLKLKILQYNLNAIKENMDKYKKDEAYDFYAVNFATLALIKSAEALMINKEMIFRAVDKKYEGKISAFDFSFFLKETLKLNDDFIRPIVEILDPENKGAITRERYTKYLECFLINEEQGNKQVTSIDNACQNIAKHIITFNNMNFESQIKPQLIWKAKEINIAILGHGLVRKVPTIDRLDCVGFYCKLDPTKRGYVETKNVVNYLVNKINDVKAFGVGSVRLQK